jgi:16S rRNA (guanine(966)-N(2))-methyltransferase RsmD
MRIITGLFKGKRIAAPHNLPVRPTTDMAKEALFNYLGGWLNFDEITAMDLFCGTGSISFELLSRGTKRIVAVDKHPACIKFVQSFADGLIKGVLTGFTTDAFIALERSKEQFDLIFADPPYDFGRYEELALKIVNSGRLTSQGMAIIEHPAEIKLTHLPLYHETRSYGKVNFSVFISTPSQL